MAVRNRQSECPQFSAKAKFVHSSPYKLRPIVDEIRGKRVDYALNILATTPVKRIVPIRKLIQSAAANAKFLKSVEAQGLVIKDIRIDEGPIFRYFKPGAMGRSSAQRRRFSHLSVVLESIECKED